MTDEKPQPKKAPPKQTASEIFLDEVGKSPPQQRSRRRRALQALAIPALAILTGLIFGGIFIILTTGSFYVALQEGLLAGLKEAWDILVTAYSALFTGAFGSPSQMIQALLSGDPAAIRQAFYPLMESLVASTPYIFAGLSVALGFRVGLFNIGAEGQIFMGAIFATFVGYALTGLPLLLHMPLAFLAGAAGGALWGFIPGWLKARTGAHEVINTIMLNYIAFRRSD